MLSLRKKLLVSVFTLLIAVVAVATTTYAWFTMGNTTEVSNISMGVESTQGLLIKVNSINGVETSTSSNSHISNLSTFRTTQDLSAAFADLALTLIPLSMTDELPGSTTEAGDGVLSELFVGQNGHEYRVSNLTAGNYIQIEFEFQSLEALSVHLDSITVTPDATGYSFITPVGFSTTGDIANSGKTEYSANEVISDVRLANALRVATTVGESGYSIISPAVYDSNEAEYGTWAGAAINYYNATSTLQIGTAATPIPTEYNYSINNDNLTNTVLTTLEDGSTEDGFAGYFGTITIIVWLEGWDADCFNPIILDKASIGFQFTGVAA